MGVTVTAHEDRYIRFFDNNTGKLRYNNQTNQVFSLIVIHQLSNFAFSTFFHEGKQIHSMVAHLDAVTCLSVDSPGLYLLSGSKYFSRN